MDKKRMAAGALVALGMSVMVVCLLMLLQSGMFSTQQPEETAGVTAQAEHIGGSGEAPADFEEEQTKPAAAQQAATAVPEQVSIHVEEAQTKSEAAAADTDAAATIAIPGLERWTIPAGTTQVEADFYNPEKNECYFVLTILLSDTNETLYQSKYIKPGQHLYQIALTKAMQAGSYSAVLQYDTYALTDNTPLNGASVPFTLVVTD